MNPRPLFFAESCDGLSRALSALIYSKYYTGRTAPLVKVETARTGEGEVPNPFDGGRERDRGLPTAPPATGEPETLRGWLRAF